MKWCASNWRNGFTINILDTRSELDKAKKRNKFLNNLAGNLGMRQKKCLQLKKKSSCLLLGIIMCVISLMECRLCYTWCQWETLSRRLTLKKPRAKLKPHREQLTVLYIKWQSWDPGKILCYVFVICRSNWIELPFTMICYTS